MNEYDDTGNRPARDPPKSKNRPAWRARVVSALQPSAFARQAFVRV